MRALVIAFVLGLPLVAVAQPAVENPWSVGVTAQAKGEAQALLEEGNALFVQNLHRDALARYEQALTKWDHPAIRFNMVRALVSLDEPLPAAEHLERAMKYGSAPFGDDVYAEALNYQRLLAGQIAVVTIRCTQAGVRAALDGEPLTCPGEETRKVRPGRHTVAAEGDGLLSQSRVEVLTAGENPAIELALVSLADAAVTRTRWATWKPWAVVVGGAAVAGTGLLLQLSARGLRDDYREALATECGSRGCAPGELSPASAALEDTYKFRDALSIGVMIAGGATLAAGITLAVLNRPYTEVPQARGIAVAPWFVGDGGGVTVALAR